MTNARIAGFTFLAYIAAGITSMIVFAQASSAEGMAAKLATMAQHATSMTVVIVLTLIEAFAALVLAVTLYAVTRDQDHDLAMLAMACRLVEGVIGGLAIQTMLDLSWVAKGTGVDAPAGAAHLLGAYLLHGDVAVSATFFAVGSTIFAYLLLRGRMIPLPLAWLGVVASALLVVCLPLKLAGVLHGPIPTVLWLPILAFEVTTGFWLLLKGVAAPARSPLA